MPKIMFPHTVTLYNHYRTASRTDAWKRTVLDLTNYTEIVDRNMTQSGVIQLEKRVTVYIHYRNGYVTPSAFSAAADKSAIWTVNTDKNLDAIVFGECIKEISTQYTLETLISEYNGVIVKSFRDNTRFRLLRHWEVGCE